MSDIQKNEIQSGTVPMDYTMGQIHGQIQTQLKNISEKEYLEITKPMIAVISVLLSVVMMFIGFGYHIINNQVHQNSDNSVLLLEKYHELDKRLAIVE